MTRQELALMLERNTYHTAAADVLDGKPLSVALDYVAARDLAPYNDGEGLWLQETAAALVAGTTTLDEL